MFALELVDLAGNSLGEPEWRSLTFDRALNGGTTLTWGLTNDQQAASFADLAETVARVWEREENEEGGLLRFQGRLRESLQAKPGTLALTAGSPFTLLDRRQLQDALAFEDSDQGAIIDYVLSQQNVRSPTGLRMGPYATTKQRDRHYDAGKSVQELIVQMAEVIEGPYFSEVFVTDELHVLAELVLRGVAGADLPGVRFEYGEGTLANLVDYTLTELLPVNRVTVAGGASEAGVTPTPQSVYSSSSIERYGLFEEYVSDPDVSVETTLTEKALARLRLDPVTLIDVTPSASGPAVLNPPVPRLWHDFDVGDTVYVSIRDDTTQVHGLDCMVTQVGLVVSEETEAEQLSLTLQRPGQEAVGP